MENIFLYCQEVQNSAAGLPAPVKGLLFELIKYLDVETGIASGFTLQGLERSMWVERTQGRQVKIITLETIRSYFRTMNRCSNGLIVATIKTKKGEVFFPLVKKAYQNFIASNKVSGFLGETEDANSPKPVRDEKGIEFQKKGELTASSSQITPALYINKIINNKNNNNNKKLNVRISEDFMPTAETIEQAMQAGLIDTLTSDEINRFITWNLDRQTTYNADIWQTKLIEWLEKTAAYNATSKTADLIHFDFTPTQETIEQGVGLGLTDVLNQAEIERFIKWNVSHKKKHSIDVWQTKYIEWLEKTASYKQKKPSKTSVKQGSKGNASESSINPKHFKSTLDEVIYNSQQMCAFVAPEQIHIPSTGGVADASFFDLDVNGLVA